MLCVQYHHEFMEAFHVKLPITLNTISLSTHLHGIASLDLFMGWKQYHQKFIGCNEAERI